MSGVTLRCTNGPGAITNEGAREEGGRTVVLGADELLQVGVLIGLRDERSERIVRRMQVGRCADFDHRLAGRLLRLPSIGGARIDGYR